MFALVLSTGGVAIAAPAAQPAAPVATNETPEHRAARAFVEGQAAFEQGDFRRAAASFEAAYSAKPHHAALWNAARSWQRAGEDLLAANLLEQYLAEAPPNAPDRDEATSTLAAVVKRVGRVQLQVVAVTNVKLDGSTPPPTTRTIFVAPGEHVATGQDREGTTVRKVFNVARGDTVSVTLSPDDKSQTGPVATEKDKQRFLSPWVVAGGGALTVIGGALTILSGVDTLDKRDAFLGDQTQSRLDDGYASQARTNVIIGVTAGIAVLTAVAAVFFVDWSGGKATSSSPTVGRRR